MGKCRRRSSTLGQAVTSLVVYAGQGIRGGTLLSWWGSGGPARVDGLGRLEIVVLGCWIVLQSVVVYGNLGMVL